MDRSLPDHQYIISEVISLSFNKTIVSLTPQGTTFQNTVGGSEGSTLWEFHRLISLHYLGRLDTFSNVLGLI